MVLAYIAYLTVGWCLYKIIAFIWKYFTCYILPILGIVHDLRKYGDWAVITGGTDGIGKEYALQLAARRFNIVLISRSDEKLEAVAKDITDKYQVKTKIIVYDFCKIDGYSKINEELRNLDIGVLVNNVGTVYGLSIPFNECDLQKTFDVMAINTFSCVGVSHAVIKGMCRRKRGLMIHISSLATQSLQPRSNVYSATKMFMNTFVKALSYENPGVIDHQIVIAGYVETKLSSVKAKFFLCPTAKAFVWSALGSVGYSDYLTGYWSHEIMYVVMQFIPTSVIIPLITKIRSVSEQRKMY